MKLWKFLFLVPHVLFAHDLVRLGSHYGGWAVPTHLLKKGAICYCGGAGEDITFDAILAEQYECEVYIIDPTPRAIFHFEKVQKSVEQGTKMEINNFREKTYYSLTKKGLAHMTYLPVGLWSSNEMLEFFYPKNRSHISCSATNIQETNEYFLAECKTLSYIMNLYNHKYIDILKIDIEGAEYEVLDHLFEANITVKCLCVEFDAVRMSKPKGKEVFAREKVIFEKYLTMLQDRGYEMLCNEDYNITFLKKGF